MPQKNNLKKKQLYINVKDFRFWTTNQHRHVEFSERSTALMGSQEEVSVSLLSLQREQQFASGGVSDQGDGV